MFSDICFLKIVFKLKEKKISIFLKTRCLINSLKKYFSSFDFVMYIILIKFNSTLIKNKNNFIIRNKFKTKCLLTNINTNIK